MSQFGCGLAFDSSTPPIVYAGVYNDIYRWMPGGVVTTKLTLVVGSSVMTLSNNLGLVSNLHLDAAPMIGAGGRTLVPIRAIVEAIGGMAEWNATSRTVTVKLGTIILELTVGKKTPRLNESAVSIDADPKVVPEIVNGRTMLPLRFVTESLGATVGWDPSTQTITITYQGA
jgi:Copper amine oxidase N-terminal domain.